MIKRRRAGGGVGAGGPSVRHYGRCLLEGGRFCVMQLAFFRFEEKKYLSSAFMNKHIFRDVMITENVGYA